MLHIIPISGKDSLATALVQKIRQPDLPYTYFFNDTGKEYPETYAWLDKVENYLGQPIERIGADLDEIIEDMGMLPSHHERFCTREAKIKPMKDAIDQPAIVYYGIRADENRTGFTKLDGGKITPAYPLIEMGLVEKDIFQIVGDRGLLPPTFFWQSMFDLVAELLGPNRFWLDNLLPLEKQKLFRGRKRPNCSNCFYQSQWELVWCLETHPAIYWADADLEKRVGGANETRAKSYTFQKNGVSYFDIARNAEKLKLKRAKAIIKALTEYGAKGVLNDPRDADDTIDFLSSVSCGLLCGK